MNFSDLPSHIPAWATTDEAVAWFYGFAIGATVRIFRAGLKWVKRIGDAAD